MDDPASHKKSARLKRFSVACPECKGMGIMSTFFGGGRFESSRDCERCHGRGEVGNCALCEGEGIAGDTECPDCRGAGAIGDCADCGGIGATTAGDCPACDGFGYT